MKQTYLLILAYLLFQTNYTLGNDRIPDVKNKLKASHLSIKNIDGKLEIFEKVSSEKRFIKNFKSNTEERIYFSEFEGINAIQAYTKYPFKKKFKKEDASDFETRDVLEKGIFFSGLRYITFTYPQVTDNSIGYLSYIRKINDPHFLNPFYFQSNAPTEKASFSVSFSENVKVRYLLFGEGTDEIRMTTSKENGMTTYQWSMENIPAYKFEKNAPSRSYTAPHIVVMIDSYEKNGKTIKVSEDVNSLYNWYNSLVNKITPCEKDILEAQLEEIVNDKMSDTQKKQAVFKWVQKNIKYIAFENGMAGFIPRSACDVIHKRYGDCKDMANLLYSFYSVLGYDAHLTWIGTRGKPYSYHELPTTITDNHMICALTEADTTLFLDATNPFSDFGTPTSMIQGKEALIAGDATTFTILKVPEVSAIKNRRLDTVRCQLVDMDIEGSISVQLSGYAKEDYKVSQYKGEIQNDHEALRDFLNIGENNIVLQEADHSKTLDTLNTHFKMPNYARNVGQKYYVNLNLQKIELGERLDEINRLYPYEKEFKKTIESHIEFIIPKGMEVSYLPPNQSIKNELGEIKAVYRQENNIIYFDKVFTSNVLLIQKEDFTTWNTFIQKVSEINQENIILKKTNLQ